MIEAKSRIAALVNRMPDADRPGATSKVTGPSPAAAAEAAEKILEGGRESLLELIGMLRDALGQGEENYKPGYLLHCVALHVSRSGKESRRRLFAETLASQLGGEKPPKDVQSFLVRELQVAGGREVVRALGRLLGDDELCEFATQALVAIREGAAPELRTAFGKASGRRRVTLAQALGAVSDEDAVDSLREASRDDHPDVRAAAVWSLARIGSPRGADAVVGAADRAQGWERIQAHKACLLLAEGLAGSAKPAAAKRIYEHLLQTTRTEPGERHVLEAAGRGLLETAR
ncbi:MAG: HEAT repeat domain-containing protein [Planctomycetota bacterium]|nr:HEAT repeat domain-containing protein [Planctomycetota bacterium]